MVKCSPLLTWRYFRSLIANQVLVSALQLLAQVLDDGLAVGSIFTSLFFIQADDIATTLDEDLSDFQRRRIFGRLALGSDLLVTPAVGQDTFADFLHRAHACA